eukprot:CAMPEP_0194481668 /NCGR_PEP_ID=MMETSP0253-20130528/3985_1 /TAXON_ID=2966 /ORGANISM="Noctiluca scintillans" /LENGTH=89 /DNA_ID=CAMNT_0039321169 /DNA_START=123 /DNA_END=392 /DNA_ORIENTATION=-
MYKNPKAPTTGTSTTLSDMLHHFSMLFGSSAYEGLATVHGRATPLLRALMRAQIAPHDDARAISATASPGCCISVAPEMLSATCDVKDA